MTVPLPPVAEADRLTEVLRRAGVLGDGRVTSVTVDKSFPTVLSQFFRLRLDYENASAAPASLILKTDLPNRPNTKWDSGRKEVAFYTEVGTATPAGLLPCCYDAHYETTTGAWHLLLEDLTCSHMIASQWPLPPTIAQSEAIVRAHARFKAAWWDDPRLGTAIGTWPDPAGIARWLQDLAQAYARFADAAGDRLSAAQRSLYERLFDQGPRLLERYLSRRNMTIVQGDSHVWNCFLPRDASVGTARLFDWDAWQLNVGAEDLAYMMAMHWYPDLRQRAERPLLDAFHAELVAHGVSGYDRRALQDDYRLAVLWLTTRPILHQAAGIPPVIWWNNLERIHLAVDDLDCRELMAG